MDIPIRQLNRELFLQARKTKTPLVGSFELTGRCNLSCRMCYVRREPNDHSAVHSELSAERWLEIGKQAAGEGLLYLLLTGGEPFLRPDFLKIYEGLRGLGLQLSINTNATLITPEIAKRLATLPPFSIGVTLYGASPETYGRACGDAGAFARTLRGIRLLREEGLPVNLRTTIIQQNWDDFEKIYAIAREMDLKFQLVDYVFANRIHAESDPFAVRLPPEGQEACLYRMVEMLAADGNPQLSSREGVHSEEDSPTGPFSCAAGSFSFAVSYSGNLCCCLMIDNPALPLEESEPFIGKWRKLVELCEKVPVCEECRCCSIRWHCTVCPAKRVGETGCFDKPAPYLCEIAKLTSIRTVGLKEA